MKAAPLDFPGSLMTGGKHSRARRPPVPWMVPFVPLHKKGLPVFSMFRNLQEFGWVLPVLQYELESAPISAFDEFILAPALELRRKLNARKAEGTAEIDLDAVLSDNRRQE